MRALLESIAQIRLALPHFEFDAKLFLWTVDRVEAIEEARDRYINLRPCPIPAIATTSKAALRVLGPEAFLNPEYRGQKFKRQTSGSSGSPSVLYKSERAALVDLCLPAWKAMRLNDIDDSRRVRSLFITDNSESTTAILVDPSGDEPRLILRLALGADQSLGFDRLIEAIRVCEPLLVTSNPNLLRAFLDHCEQRNLEPRELSFAGFLCSGGVLSPDTARRLRRAAPGGLLLDAYVSTEFGYLGARCGEDRFHLDESLNSYRIDEDGKLLVSSIYNEAMPLKDFDIGDRVTLHPRSNCACGKPGLLVDRIDGRVLPDFFLAGRRVSPSVYMHAFKKFPELEEYQLTQTGDLCFDLKIEVKARTTSFPFEAFLNFIRAPLGDGVTITASLAAGLHQYDKFQRFRRCQV
ncbi:MAG TPA: hypothetical protein VM901_05370 [Bdellovibrionota bacterium]|jgi:hypothetical protein|nr:hypothetical protein [Bdellovibrionota bacterium]